MIHRTLKTLNKNYKKKKIQKKQNNNYLLKQNYNHHFSTIKISNVNKSIPFQNTFPRHLQGNIIFTRSFLNMKKKIKRIESDEGRFYQIDGVVQPLPSVTTILGMINKPDLELWKTQSSFDNLKESFYERQNQLVSDLKLIDQAKDTKGFISFLRGERSWIQGAISRAMKSPKTISNTAAVFGLAAHDEIDKMVHELILDPKSNLEIFKKKERKNIDKDRMDLVHKAFIDWHEEYKFRFLLGDTMIYNTAEKYAGAFDALVLTPSNTLAVLDWKTTNRIHPSYAIQLSAYAKSVQQQINIDQNLKMEFADYLVRKGLTCDFLEKKNLEVKAGVVRFGREGGYELKWVRDIDKSFEDFKACITLFYSMKENNHWE